MHEVVSFAADLDTKIWGGAAAMSLKDFCRAFIVDHAGQVEYANPANALPDELITYLDLFKMRGMSFRQRQETLAEKALKKLQAGQTKA